MSALTIMIEIVQTVPLGNSMAGYKDTRRLSVDKNGGGIHMVSLLTLPKKPSPCWLA